MINVRAFAKHFAYLIVKKASWGRYFHFRFIDLETKTRVAKIIRSRKGMGIHPGPSVFKAHAFLYLFNNLFF